MTVEIGILLLLIVVAMVLFSLERIPPDAVALLLLVLLVVTGCLPAERAFEGFGSETVMLIFGLLVLTAGLWRTGVMDLVGRRIYRHTGNRPMSLLVVVVLVSIALSAFISNTASTAFLVPIVVGIAQRARFSASRLLMPLAFGAILASSVTLISTSTNIVISGLITRYGMAPLGMFELSPVGVPIALVGAAYMILVGHKLIPVRVPEGTKDDPLSLRPYASEIMILPGSIFAGKTLAESNLGRDLDLTVMRIVRDKSQVSNVPTGATVLREGDTLLVEGNLEELLKIKDTAGISIKADVKLEAPETPDEELSLAEGILLPRSPLIGRTLKGYRFRERYGVQVLGINRRSAVLRKKLSEIPLRAGDVLLLQGPQANLGALRNDAAFQSMGALDDRRPNRRRAPLSILIFAGSLLLAVLKILPMGIAVLLGATLVFLTRCITPQEAYREIEWKAIIVIGSMLALGTAMEETGTAVYLAGMIAGWSDQIGIYGLLTGFFVLTVVLTQPMSNQAAAVVVLPVAVQAAIQLGLDPRTFAVLIAVAASCSYLTPLEPACVLVYGPGRYRFFDFLKVGLPLTVLIYGIAIALVPRIWPP